MLTVFPCPALTITTTNPLPSGTVGAPYSLTLAATGGAWPYTWWLGTGWQYSGGLPDGLGLDSSGAIIGTPTDATNVTFTVLVYDSVGVYVSTQFDLTIIAPLTIVTASPFPDGTTGVPYSQALAATGGTEPYTWGLISGSLLDGLGFDTGGTISGTPTEPGTTSFQAQVTDDNGVTTNQTFSLTITNSPLTITTSSPLPNGTVGVAYNQSLAATGGTGSYTWAPALGLPDGLSLSSSGAITGIPTTAEIANFQAQVTDTAGATASTLFSLTVTNVTGGCTWTITTSVNPAGAGNGGSPLAVRVNCGATVKVTAAPKPCYSFVNWTEGGSVVSTSPSYSFTATANRTLVANFAQTLYTITTSSSPSSWGTTGGGGTETCGSLVTVTASPKTGFAFANWKEGGRVVSASSNYTFTASANRTLVANFKDIQPPSLVITSPPPGQLWGVWGTANFTASGTATDNVAVASVSYRFNGGAWTNANGTTNWTTANLSLSQGTNLLQAYAVDTSGNCSLTNSVGFVYVSVLPVQVPPTSLPSATQNASYSTPLPVIGGKPPYVWSLGPGSAALPPGLSLSSIGVISGFPSTAGTNSFTVSVTDALNTTANQIMTLTVIASTNPPVVVLTAPSLSGSGQFQFTCNTTAGLIYTLLYSTDLETWTPLLSFGGPGGPQTVTDPNAAGASQRFYRVEVGSQ